MAFKPNTPKHPPLEAGQKFGRLTAVAFVRRNKEHRPVWKWMCDCGKEHEAIVKEVRRTDRRATNSCGCVKRENVIARNKANATHGMTNSPEFGSWRAILERCYNPNSKDFKKYGSRGIAVCQRWKEFENFLADMGPRPLGTTIDRYPDNDGNYEPGNCRWATATQQARNRRNSKFVEYEGKKTPLIEVAEKCGVPYVRLWQRLKLGWSVDRATTTNNVSNYRILPK